MYSILRCREAIYRRKVMFARFTSCFTIKDISMQPRYVSQDCYTRSFIYEGKGLYNKEYDLSRTFSQAKMIIRPMYIRQLTRVLAMYLSEKRSTNSNDHLPISVDIYPLNYAHLN